MIDESQRFTPKVAAATLSSILYNHDTHPDLVTMTCELAKSLRKSLTVGEAREMLAAEDIKFDSEGWFTE
jgi:hypothetical protein